MGSKKLATAAVFAAVLFAFSVINIVVSAEPAAVISAANLTSVRPQPVNPFNHNVSAVDFTEAESPVVNGSYIVKLNDERALSERTDTLNQIKYLKEELRALSESQSFGKFKDIYTETELDASVADAAKKLSFQKIEAERYHKAALRDIIGRIAGGESGTLGENDFAPIVSGNFSVEREYYSAFSGFAVKADSAALEEIKKSSFVKDVYANRIVTADLMDSVPLINATKVWQIDADGNNCATSGKACLTGTGITIAVIDTGVDYTHPDLGGCLGINCKVVGGYDFINDDANPMDDQGHGTHVAATAAGNGVLKGAAPDAKIIAYKVLDADGSGSFEYVIAGIDAAVADGADIISMSLGGDCGGYYYEECGPDDPAAQAIDEAAAAGVVPVIDRKSVV